MGQNTEYDDIIDLPRPVSTRHPQMPLSDRAAQFSPFAALTGHDAVIRETARLTRNFSELDENRKEQLDRQLQILRKYQSRRPEIEVVYFRPDPRKSGGDYAAVRGKVKKIDESGHRILFEDGSSIPIETVSAIEGELFRMWDME